MSRLIKASLLGGLIVFTWSALSWMVLPWHKATIKEFQHDADVASVLDFASPTSGIYLLGQSREYKPSDTLHLMAFVALSKAEGRRMTTAMLMGLVVQILGAFLAAWMLSRTQGLSYKQKVLFITAFGFATGWLGQMPNFIWWNFPADFTMVAMADALIGWTFAGLVMGKCL